jgi:hypothetical protein
MLLRIEFIPLATGQLETEWAFHFKLEENALTLPVKPFMSCPEPSIAKHAWIQMQDSVLKEVVSAFVADGVCKRRIMAIWAWITCCLKMGCTLRYQNGNNDCSL